MERPALRRLLDEITAGKIKIVVVYKVDRLTRSLADFAKIVDVLDANGASFVSVTQQFNTTTSMGRLTLNMLLSFAQFEREIAGERIRDKIAASKAKGMWMGGSVPLGYDVEDRALVVNEAEAETVRLVFRRYAELGSVALLRAELDDLGIVSKTRNRNDKSVSGGQSFARGALYTLLQNRIYIGEVVHKGTSYPGKHNAIVDSLLWNKVQERLATNRKERSVRSGAKAPSFLAGRIVDSNGDRMTPTHAVKSGKRYRYYVTTALITDKRDTAPQGQRLPAGDIENLVLGRLESFLASPAEFSEVLAPLALEAPVMEMALRNSAGLSERWLSATSIERHAIAQSLIRQVAVGEEKVLIDLYRERLLGEIAVAVPSTIDADASARGSSTIRLTIKANLRRVGKGKRMVVGGMVAANPDPALIKLVARALATRNELMSGSDDSLEAMTRRLRTTRGYLNSLVRLSYLAPDIVRTILTGNQPIELNVKRLLAAAKTLPVSWTQQRDLLGFDRK